MEKVSIDGLTITGINTRTKNADEIDPQKAKIRPLWKDFFQMLEQTDTTPPEVFGVYHNYESDENGAYDLTVGMQGEFSRKNTMSVTIPPGRYIKFTRSGPPCEASMALWQEAWTYFNKPDSPHRIFACDFEAYSGTDTLDLFIGIKEN